MSFRPSRREVLAGGLGAGAAYPLLSSMAAPRWLQAAGMGYKKLVIVQLAGANDFINNVVNPDEPNYKRARPRLALDKSKMIRVDGSSPYYFHPALAPFKRLLDKGQLSMLPGIGYPTPNYSHFRSMDIWAEADPTARNVTEGWVAGFLKRGYVGTDAVRAIDIENRLNRVFSGYPVPVLRSAAAFQFAVDRFTTLDRNTELAKIEANAKAMRSAPNSNLKFLVDAVGQVPADARLLSTTGSGYTPRATYPNTTRARALARDMQLAARYITGGMTTPIYQVRIGGWDTHANQVETSDNLQGRHMELLEATSGCIEAFLKDLEAWGKADDVLVMVWSEFGRRVGENGNNGSDHGAAGIAYLAGKPVKKPGFQSPFPDWSVVRAPYNRFNFMHTVDFRRLYATILEDYWGVDSAKVLGQKWQGLGLV